MSDSISPAYSSPRWTRALYIIDVLLRSIFISLIKRYSTSIIGNWLTTSTEHEQWRIVGKSPKRNSWSVDQIWYRRPN